MKEEGWEIKVLSKIAAMFKIGGIRLIAARISDRLRGTKKTPEVFEDICRKAPVKKYPKILENYYFISTGKTLNLSNPQTLTQKIQWLKIYDTTKAKSELTDKYLVRKWVEDVIGKDYLIPLIGAYDSPDEINFNELPTSFVIKENHGSGMNIIVKNKSELDIEECKKRLQAWLTTDFSFKCGFELQYRDIKPKIIIEKYISPLEGQSDITDYKFYCFNGKPTYCQVITNRSEHECIDFYDMDWNHMPFTGMTKNAKNSPQPIKRPTSFDEMKRLAEIMSKEFYFVRVDLYDAGGKVLFGEMTFTPNAGLGYFYPEEWDFKLGKMLNLPIDTKSLTVTNDREKQKK